MSSTDFSSGVGDTRLSATRPVRKNTMPATRTAAIALVDFHAIHAAWIPPRSATQRHRDPPARRCAGPFASISWPHHRETTLPLQPACPFNPPAPSTRPPLQPALAGSALREPDRRHSLPHGVHPPAGQAAGRHPWQADDRARAGSRAGGGYRSGGGGLRRRGDRRGRARRRRHCGDDRSHSAARLGPGACGAGRARPAGPARRGGEPARRPADHPAGLSAHGADAAGRPGASTSPRWWRRSSRRRRRTCHPS